MTDRLLSDEERRIVLYGELGIARPVDGDELLCQAQDIKTLKAVGEWLEEINKAGGTYYSNQGWVKTFRFNLSLEGWNQLKQGKMPEE